MCLLATIILLALSTPVYGKELVVMGWRDKQNHWEKLTMGNSMHTLTDRARAPTTFQSVSLDNATLAKSGQPLNLPQPGLRSQLMPSNCAQLVPSCFTIGDSALCWGCYHQSLHQKTFLDIRSHVKAIPRRRMQLRGLRLLCSACSTNLNFGEQGRNDKEADLVLNHDVQGFHSHLGSAGLGGNKMISGILGPGWMHETSLLEQGSVLLSDDETSDFALQHQYFHKCVVLVLNHGDRRDRRQGIILNRPTSRKLADWPLWYGGNFADGGLFHGRQSINAQQWHAEGGAPLNVTCLHQLTNESIKALSTRIIKEVYAISFENAKLLVAAGDAKKDDFWVFAGYVDWAPGQLHFEMQRKGWSLANADSALLLRELLDMSNDPLSLPRVDPDTKQLLAGGDGLGLWTQLAANIGKTDDIEGSFADRMLRQWVLEHLTRYRENRRNASGFEESAATTIPQFDAGTVLVCSDTQRFLLEKQYLHKSIMIVLGKNEDEVITAVLNRPRTKPVEFTMPGGNLVKTWRVSVAGERGPVDSSEDMMPFHHRRGFGGVELGTSGVFMATSDFTGSTDDLLMVGGLLTWPPADLQRQIDDGTFSVVNNGKLPWKRIWDLADASIPSDNLEERINHVRQKTNGNGTLTLEMFLDRQKGLAKRSQEAWELAMSEAGRALPNTGEIEQRLADEALFEWGDLMRKFKPPVRRPSLLASSKPLSLPPS